MRDYVMSDHWLIVAPCDPYFIPSAERQTAAFELLKSLRPRAQNWELQVSETPEFFVSPEGFETIFCPFCATDVKEFWFEEMDRWHATDRRSLETTTPCCKRQISLNDLDYVQPQAFACFAVELMRGGPDLEPAEREQVEAALGAPVRTFWRFL
jgi:hypothetical protein